MLNFASFLLGMIVGGLLGVGLLILMIMSADDK